MCLNPFSDGKGGAEVTLMINNIDYSVLILFLMEKEAPI